LESTSADYLTSVILQALEDGGDVGTNDIAEKLLCFGTDGVTVFQGSKTGVTKQLQTKYMPFMTGVHCFAH
jgi:hypothetical protein